MEVREIINKWFSETKNLIDKKIDKDNFDSSDGLSLSVINLAKEYCDGVFLLIEHKYQMPAQALLRVLFELWAKFVWCVTVPDKNEVEENRQIIEDKIKRWEKEAVCKHIEMLEKSAITSDEHIKNMKKHHLYRNEKVKQMPRFAEIISELSGPLKSELHPLCYKQFNNAIHLDPKSLIESFKKQYKLKTSDITKYCIIHAYHFNYIIRKGYKLDVELLKKEYFGII